MVVISVIWPFPATLDGGPLRHRKKQKHIEVHLQSFSKIGWGFLLKDKLFIPSHCPARSRNAHKTRRSGTTLPSTRCFSALQSFMGITRQWKLNCNALGVTYVTTNKSCRVRFWLCLLPCPFQHKNWLLCYKLHCKGPQDYIVIQFYLYLSWPTISTCSFCGLQENGPGTRCGACLFRIYIL